MISRYWRLVSGYLSNVGWQVGLVCAVLPLLLGLLLVQLVSTYLLHGLLNFAIVLLVLLLTLRVRNYSRVLAAYSKALAEQDWQSGSKLAFELTEGVQADDFARANLQLGRWVSMDLFRGWFVGLFWFGVLGVYGATTYWLWRRLAIELSKRDDQERQGYLEGLYRYLYWAEYLPVRLWTAGYALVGEFVPTFDWLMEELWGDLPSDQMVVQGSLLALGSVASSEPASVDNSDLHYSEETAEAISEGDSLLELQQIVRLNSRLFAIWLVLLVVSGLLGVLM